MTDSLKKRTAPLAAPTAESLHLDVADIEPHDVAPEDIAAPTVATPSSVEAAMRDQRFTEGVRTLRVGGATLRLEERILMILGGVLAPLGIVMVLLGWWGAAHTPYVFEQLPYVISGGLLGVGLVFLGAFFYFTHWITQLVKEHRVQSVAVLEALQRLQDQVARQSDGQPSTVQVGANGSSADSVVLVATAQGTMAHRPACAVVAGKTQLRRVTEADGLAACKLCEPYRPLERDAGA